MQTELLNILKDAYLITLPLIGWGILAFFIEKIRPAHKDRAFVTDATKLELTLYYLSMIALRPFLEFLLLLIIFYFVQDNFVHAGGEKLIASWPVWLQLAAALLVADFSTYWRHRFMHVNKKGWLFHSIHHDAKAITWTTAFRVHPGDLAASFLLDPLLLHLFGFPHPVIIYAATIVYGVGILSHFNIDLDWGKPLRYLIASPNYHRWHHGLEKEAVDKNFSVLFPFIDMAFGTFYYPQRLPKAYGIFKCQVPDDFWGKIAYPIRKWSATYKDYNAPNSSKPKK
ncbi:MAG: sterol desaturase family protein [Pseudomonadota bacterium]|nr:sterol desaturase family protein [Pseudomonadota bacterium]QKK04917.1 MAG: sterol desaturase family protein [Pseudomonadota bacterium]